MAITRSSSVEIVGLHIYEELAGSISDSTASSRSEDRHSDNLGFDDIISDRREYEIMVSVLQLVSLFSFSFLL